MSQNWDPKLSVFGDEVESEFTSQIDAAVDQGIGNIEVRTAAGINVTELSSETLTAMKKELDSRSLGVSAIGSPVGKAAVTGDFEIEKQRLRACADAARIFGTDLIRVFSYFVPNGDYTGHRDEILRRMSTLAKLAEELDVTLVHENESYVYGDTPERCVDLIESVGSERLTVCFDPANFYQVGVLPFTEAWPMLRKYVTHFHVKDAVKVDRTGIEPYPTRAPEDRLMASVRPAGVGDAELAPLIAALAEDNYSGYLTLEPHLRWYMPEATGPECLAEAHRSVRTLIDAANGAS